MINLQRKGYRDKFGYYLAGFVEGEGSFTIAIKWNNNMAHGIALDPVFSLTQHESGRHILEATKEFFKAGTIKPKSGNEKVLVFNIYNRKTIKEKVLPFWEKYGYMFSGKQETFDNYKKIILLLENKHHKTKEGLLECLEYAYKMNSQAKGKKRKFTLNQIKEKLL